MAPSAYATAFDVEMAMAHIPVLTDELLELLDVRSTDRVVDGTFGAGGHAGAVGRRLGPEGLLVHAKFGNGVVLSVESGGVVRVFFPELGEQKKLLLDYAPLKRV